MANKISDAIRRALDYMAYDMPTTEMTRGSVSFTAPDVEKMVGQSAWGQGAGMIEDAIRRRLGGAAPAWDLIKAVGMSPYTIGKEAWMAGANVPMTLMNKQSTVGRKAVELGLGTVLPLATAAVTSKLAGKVRLPREAMRGMAGVSPRITGAAVRGALSGMGFSAGSTSGRGIMEQKPVSQIARDVVTGLPQAAAGGAIIGGALQGITEVPTVTRAVNRMINPPAPRVKSPIPRMTPAEAQMYVKANEVVGLKKMRNESVMDFAKRGADEIERHYGADIEGRNLHLSLFRKKVAQMNMGDVPAKWAAANYVGDRMATHPETTALAIREQTAIVPKGAEMMVKNMTAAERFFSGETGKAVSSKNMWSEQMPDGTRVLYSYGRHYPMAVIKPDGKAYLNTEGYSVTTSGHINRTRRAAVGTGYNLKEIPSTDAMKNILDGADEETALRAAGIGVPPAGAEMRVKATGKGGMPTQKTIQQFEETGFANVDDEAVAMQQMIEGGQSWKLQGSYGRSMMDAIESGRAMLGAKPTADYYGNRIPSRTEVQAGTKGSPEFVANTMGVDYLRNVLGFKGKLKTEVLTTPPVGAEMKTQINHLGDGGPYALNKIDGQWVVWNTKTLEHLGVVKNQQEGIKFINELDDIYVKKGYQVIGGPPKGAEAKVRPQPQDLMGRVMSGQVGPEEANRLLDEAGVAANDPYRVALNKLLQNQNVLPTDVGMPPAGKAKGTLPSGKPITQADITVRPSALTTEQARALIRAKGGTIGFRPDGSRVYVPEYLTNSNQEIPISDVPTGAEARVSPVARTELVAQINDRIKRGVSFQDWTPNQQRYFEENWPQAVTDWFTNPNTTPAQRQGFMSDWNRKIGVGMVNTPPTGAESRVKTPAERYLTEKPVGSFAQGTPTWQVKVDGQPTVFTPQDVADYFGTNHGQSGMRSFGPAQGDWRMIDNIANDAKAFFDSQGINYPEPMAGGALISKIRARQGTPTGAEQMVRPATPAQRPQQMPLPQSGVQAKGIGPLDQRTLDSSVDDILQILDDEYAGQTMTPTDVQGIVADNKLPAEVANEVVKRITGKVLRAGEEFEVPLMQIGTTRKGVPYHYMPANEYEYASTIMRMGPEGQETIKFGSTNGKLTVVDDITDWFDDIVAGARQWKGEGYRGYHETPINPKYVKLSSGWITGMPDETTTRKADLGAIFEKIQSGEIVPPRPIYWLFEPTSNVFSTASDILVKKADIGAITNWLKQAFNLSKQDLQAMFD